MHEISNIYTQIQQEHKGEIPSSSLSGKWEDYGRWLRDGETKTISLEVQASREGEVEERSGSEEGGREMIGFSRKFRRPISVGIMSYIYHLLGWRVIYIYVINPFGESYIKLECWRDEA